VIVGASVAGTRVAVDLRRLGYLGRIVLVDAQDEIPYDRPPLSKVMLTGDDGAAVRLLTRDEASTTGIELLLGAGATGLDTTLRLVTLSDGTNLHYDQLVVATGARPRPTAWPRNKRIVELRTLADAEHLRTMLRSVQRVAIVGAGFIGAEVASAARSLGLHVSLIDPAEVPLGRLFGDELGRRFCDLHKANGVQCYFGVGVASIDPQPDGVRLALGDGSELAADLVVVGIGVLPEVSWLAGSGVDVDDGVLCTSGCRALGHPNIWAAGDVARWLHPRHGKPVRVEHWTNAMEQAQFVASAIAHPDSTAEFTPVEYVWSDQYDWKIQIAGITNRDDEPTVITGADPSRVCALWSDGDGAVVGGLSLNWPKAAMLTRRAVAAGTPASTIQATLAGQPHPTVPA
jgi:NADPH-dependent 2,4-dienoyl-CoA reductase/sulfur reductase-like enzyme